MASYLTTSVCGLSQLSDLCSFCSVSPPDRVGFIFIVHPQPVAICKSFSESLNQVLNLIRPPLLHLKITFGHPTSTRSLLCKKCRMVSFWVGFQWRNQIYSGLWDFTLVLVLLAKFLWKHKSKYSDQSDQFITKSI